MSTDHTNIAEHEPKKFWTGEAVFAAIGCGLTVIGALGILGAHAVTVSYRVTQLETLSAASQVIHESHEKRMQSIETQVNANQAASDKRESLLEKSLEDISTRLNAIQQGVDQLQQHHH